MNEFHEIVLNSLYTNDTKLQKMSLDLLIKSDYEYGLLKYYRKLLEGFTDDEKFKDMISAITFGS